MDKKITRRVAMGTLVAGLASGPFIIRALRQPRNLSAPTFDVDAALEIFHAERERWLRFRGLKANAVIAIEGQSPATNGKLHSLSESGVMSLQISEERVGEDQLPWNFRLCFDPDGDKESGEYTTFSDLSKKPVLKGRRTEVADPQVLLDTLAAPFAFFASPWTELEMVERLLEIDVWRLESQAPTGSVTDGFVFMPTDKNKDPVSLPEVGFDAGCFSYIKGKTREGYGYCRECKEMINVTNYSFPVIFTSEINFVAEQARLKHSIRLSDVELSVI